MKEEIQTRLDILQKKIDETEPGSVQRNHYVDVKRELESKLSELTNSKLHVDEGAVCTACE